MSKNVYATPAVLTTEDNKPSCTQSNEHTNDFFAQSNDDKNPWVTRTNEARRTLTAPRLERTSNVDMHAAPLAHEPHLLAEQHLNEPFLPEEKSERDQERSRSTTAEPISAAIHSSPPPVSSGKLAHVHAHTLVEAPPEMATKDTATAAAVAVAAAAAAKAARTRPHSETASALERRAPQSEALPPTSHAAEERQSASTQQLLRRLEEVSEEDGEDGDRARGVNNMFSPSPHKRARTCIPWLQQEISVRQGQEEGGAGGVVGEEDWEDEEEDESSAECAVCRSRADAPRMLLCDGQFQCGGGGGSAIGCVSLPSVCAVIVRLVLTRTGARRQGALTLLRASLNCDFIPSGFAK